MRKMSKVFFHAVIALIHLSGRRRLKKTCHCEMCGFVSLKARRKSLISVLYLEWFLGGLGGGKVGRDKTKEFSLLDKIIDIF